MRILLDSFKAVLETERKAEKIIEIARKQAEKIRNNAQENSQQVYSKTYQNTIDEARRKSVEIKEQAKQDGMNKAQVFVKQAKKQKKELVVLADQNFTEAVNYILKEILS